MWLVNFSYAFAAYRPVVDYSALKVKFAFFHQVVFLLLFVVMVVMVVVVVVVMVVMVVMVVVVVVLYLL